MKKLLTNLSLTLLVSSFVVAETVVMDPVKVDAENAKRRMAEEKAKNAQAVPVHEVEKGQLGKENVAHKAEPKAAKERRASRWSKRNEVSTSTVQHRSPAVQQVNKVNPASKQHVTKQVSGTKETWRE